MADHIYETYGVKRSRIRIAKMRPEQVADEIGNFIVNETVSMGKKGIVLGLSGGVDSTCVAILAKRAFDRYNEADPDANLEVKAYMLPTWLNPSEDAADAVEVAEKLGIRYEIWDISDAVKGYSKIIPGTFANRFHLGNHISEVRSGVLRRFAAEQDMLVAGTGNRDEDFVVAYYTLYGDGAVHMSPIGNMPKRLVREMVGSFGFKRHSKREPTAGLEPNQTDFKDLGYRYDTCEVVFEGIRQGLDPYHIISDPAVVHLSQKDMADYSRLFGKAKFTSAEQIVNNVFHRMRVAAKKAGTNHPPAPEITLIYE